MEALVRGIGSDTLFRPAIRIETFNERNLMRLAPERAKEFAGAFFAAYAKSSWQGLEGIQSAEDAIGFYGDQVIRGRCRILLAVDESNKIAGALIALNGRALLESIDPEASGLRRHLDTVFRDFEPDNISYRAERFTLPQYRKGGLSKRLIGIESEIAMRAGQAFIMSQTLIGGDENRVLESVLRDGARIVKDSETDIELDVKRDKIKGAKTAKKLVYWVKNILGMEQEKKG